MYHLRLAAIGGLHDARNSLEVIAYTDSNLELAMKDFIIAAEAGCDDSLKNIKLLRACLSCFRKGNKKTVSEGPPRGLRRCFCLVGSGSEFVLLFLGVLFKKQQNDFQKVGLLLSPHDEQSNGVLLLTMQQN
jgi:hypothetical protein